MMIKLTVADDVTGPPNFVYLSALHITEIATDDNDVTVVSVGTSTYEVDESKEEVSTAVNDARKYMHSAFQQ